MQQKISQELYNISLSSSVLIGDSEIILKMITKDNPVFYGTRIMDFAGVTTSYNWFGCPGSINSEDLLTRAVSTCDQIKSDFWLQGSFLPQPGASWPVKKCTSLLSNTHPLQTIHLAILIMVNPFSNLIISLLEHAQSF